MKPEKFAAYFARLKIATERETRFDERAIQWQHWIDKAIEAEIEGGGDPDVEAHDFLPELLAAQHDVFDQEMAQLDAKHRHEESELRRQLITQTISFVSERRKRAVEASVLRKKIAVLETQLAHEKLEREGLVKAVASLDQTIAKDRAHRRLLDARRTYPHRSRIELEKAKRRTDQLIEDRMSEGGSFDA